MAELNVTCPACGGTLHAHSEIEMIGKVQQHGKKEHGMDMTVQKVKDMIAQQSKAD